MNFIDLNANYEFDEGIDTLNQNDEFVMDVDNDVCCKRAPKGDLDLLAACPARAERVNGKHVYYEIQEECRFEGTTEIEFYDSLHQLVQIVSEEMNEQRDQQECCDAKRNGHPGMNLENACVTYGTPLPELSEEEVAQRDSELEAEE